MTDKKFARKIKENDKSSERSFSYENFIIRKNRIIILTTKYMFKKCFEMNFFVEILGLIFSESEACLF